MAADINIKIGAQTDEFVKKLGAVEKRLQRAGAKMQKIGSSMSIGITAPIALLGGSILKTAGDFESSMNAMKAVTSGAESSFGDLEAKAKQLGATTQFSANEAAAGMEMLGRNGLTASQILDGAADASLNLAAATGTDLGNAANIATDAMAQFGLKASELIGVTDIITGATVNSKFSIDDFQGAMAQAGGVAGAVGVSFDDFAATVAAISPSFASGSDAGTSLKTMLTRLVPESDKAAQMMQQLGIMTADGSNRFFDAQGNMKSMSDVAGILQESFSGLSEAQRINAAKTLFGTDAMRAGLKLAETGSASYDQLKESLMGVTATDVAQTRMEGFNGAMLRLKSAFETLQLAIADSGVLDFATSLAESLAGVMLRLSELDPQTLKVATSIAAVVAAIGPALFAFGKMQSLAGTLVGNYRSLVTGISKMSAMIRTATASQAGFNVVMAANPVGLVIVAVAALVGILALLYKKNEKVRNLMDNFYNNVLKPLGKFLWDLGKIWVDLMVSFYTNAFKVFKAIGGFIAWLVGKWLNFLERFPLVGKVIKWLKGAFQKGIAFIGQLFSNLPAFFAGLTAEARNMADKMKAFFTRLALSAQIIAAKVKRALTVRPAERKKLTEEIGQLSKAREKAGEVGKDFGESFREGFAEEMERQALLKLPAPEAEGDGGDGGGDGGGGGGGAVIPADTSEADKAAKKAEDEAKRKEEERIAAEKRLAEQTQQIQRETIDASLELMQDGIEKEKKIQENRFSNEIADLEAQKVNKETLTAAEIAFNDSIDKLIETKREQHNKALADIDKKYTEQSTEFKMQKLDEEAALQLAIANQTINDEEKLAEERKKIAADLAQAKLDLINAEIAATGNATEEQIKQINELKSVISSMTGSPAVSSLEEMMTRIAEETGPIVTAALSDMSVGIVEGIGDIAAGTGNMQTVLSGILGTVAGMMSQLGKLAVGTGLAVEGIKKALESLNPIAAIAAGVALLALSRVVSARAASIGQAGQDRLPAFANGGLVTSPTLGMFGEAGPEALIPKKRLDSLLARAENGGVGGDGVLTTRISGNDLEIVLDKTRRRNNRVR